MQVCQTRRRIREPDRAADASQPAERIALWLADSGRKRIGQRATGARHQGITQGRNVVRRRIESRSSGTERIGADALRRRPEQPVSAAKGGTIVEGVREA